jgi:dTDP-4-dehydrorhamnose reductase
MTSIDLMVLGGTGLAGRAIMAAARQRKLSAVTLARRGDLAVDIRNADAFQETLARIAPRVIVNAAAMVSIPACEHDPGAAWLINARPAAILADYARGSNARVVHISTDHFYTGDGRRRHGEGDPVRLVNDYARVKYAAEGFALTAPSALVLRTNFVGWPSATGGSLAEWALQVIEGDLPADLYDDQFVSCLDVWTLADSVLDLAFGDAVGLLNLGAGEVFSKSDFVLALAKALNRPLSRAKISKVGAQATPRADSLGLDVSRAERILGRSLPTLDRVIANLLAHLEDRASLEDRGA